MPHTMLFYIIIFLFDFNFIYNLIFLNILRSFNLHSNSMFLCAINFSVEKVILFSTHEDYTSIHKAYTRRVLEMMNQDRMIFGDFSVNC